MQKNYEFVIQKNTWPHFPDKLKDWPYYIQARKRVKEGHYVYMTLGEGAFCFDAKIPMECITEIYKQYDFRDWLYCYYLKSEEDAQQIIEGLESLFVMKELVGGFKNEQSL